MRVLHVLHRDRDIVILFTISQIVLNLRDNQNKEESMNVTLRPDQERVVSEAISAGLIGDAVEVVDLGIETIRQRLELGAFHVRRQEIEGAVDQLRKFGDKYHFSLGGLTIKEFINEGRR
jgi:hypothetical protein